MFKKIFLKFTALLLIVISGLACAQPNTDADEQSLLSAFAAYTDLRIVSVRQNLEILASTVEAQSGKWDGMKPLLSGYQKSDSGLIVWFLRPDGTYYTVDKGLMDVKLSDRSYFPALMKGETITGALVVSKSTGQRSAIIAIPMKMGNSVVGAIGVSLFLDKFAEQVDSTLALRPDASFFAVAPNGQTTLHKKTERHFVDPREMGSETLKKATNEILVNQAGSTSYQFDGAIKKAVYRTSPLTGWKFVLTFSATK